MRKLDPNDVYQRALTNPAGVSVLDAPERLIYAVKELETYIAMQGWTRFFTGSCAYLYPEVRRCLELCGSARSLAILDDYVAYLRSVGVPMDADAIEEWDRADRPERLSLPAWGKQFQGASAERWEAIRSYFQAQNIELMDLASVASSDRRVESSAAELAGLIGGGSPKVKCGG